MNSIKVNVNYYAESYTGQVAQDTCEISVRGTTKLADIAEYIKQSIGAKTVVVVGVVK